MPAGFAMRNSECKLTVKPPVKLVDLHAHLLHGIALTDRHAAVGLRIKIIGDAERRPDLVCPSVALSDRASVVEFTVILL